MNMTPAEFQRRLIALGYNIGTSGPDRNGVDGDLGAMTRAAFLAMMTDGPDTPMTPRDIDMGLAMLRASQPRITLAHVHAVIAVEASGRPFTDGRPTILPEPHRFSRATGHQFDASHPSISSREWNRALYPASQADRYEQLWQMVALDPWAGMASASYGAFQILGENFLACRFRDPMVFARAHATTVGAHLVAFVNFVLNTRNMAAKLAACRPGDAASCEPFCAAYNGTAYRLNAYHVRFAQALARYA